MTRKIFREAALQRLASPEQLDRPARLVQGRAWMALLALVLAAGATVAWAVHATAPVKVAGQGILFEDGLLVQIIAAAPGRIDQLDLVPGAVVPPGAVIATLGRPDLALDLAKTRADLADARDRFAEIERAQADSEAREAAGEAARLETLAVSQGHVTRRVALLEQKIQSVQELLQRDLVVRDRLIETELDLSLARERVAELEDESSLLAMRQLERQSRARLALLDERLKVTELERRLNRLEAQLGTETAVRATSGGRVAEVQVSLGDVVTAGQPIATLIRADTGGVGVALVYVAPRDGRRIRPGMAVELVPSTVQRQEYGHVTGVVDSVSDVPATVEGMRAVLKNDQLAADLAGSGAPIPVRVRLDTADTPSGLAWSSSQGPPQRIASGTLLGAAIVVERVAILTLLAPGLDRTLGLVP